MKRENAAEATTEDRPTPDEAREWLKEHFGSDLEPHVDITWQPAAPDPAAYQRLLEILFASRPDSSAA